MHRATILSIINFLLLSGCSNGSSDDASREGVDTSRANTKTERSVVKTRDQLDPHLTLLLTRAEFAVRAGAHANALTVLEGINRKAPDFDYAFVLRGQVLSRLQRFDEAESAFRTALKINPGRPGVYFLMGNNSASRRMYAEALQFFRSELALAKESDPAEQRCAIWLQIARMHREIGDADAALTALAEAVTIDSTYAEAQAEIGELYEQAGQLDNALLARTRALEADPDNAEYGYQVGFTLAQLGRPEDAILYLEEARHGLPSFFGVHYSLGHSLLAVGRKEEGMRYLAMADSLRDVDKRLGIARTNAEVNQRPELWIEYASLLQTSGRYEEALEAYQVALGIDPDNKTGKAAVSELRELLATQAR